jgi:hypothetical protein
MAALAERRVLDDDDDEDDEFDEGVDLGFVAPWCAGSARALFGNPYWRDWDGGKVGAG